MVLRFGAVGEPTDRCAERYVAALAAEAPVHDRTLHFSDGADVYEGAEVAVGDPGELRVDGLEEVVGVIEAGIGGVAGLGVEAHGHAVRVACIIFLVVDT